ncbi:DUF397 domain-containing protein [Streptomyces sp. enrichment culture]|uniref:DUF397 domain-containing protein n=1 Tax=Streptomyces sp. enrichment culture TaxID=1795815 RepID=UPI003F551E5D
MSTHGGLDWFKSSYSGSEGDDCVEVAVVPGTVHVRDSKSENGPRFEVSGSAWREFVAFVDC